MSTHHALYIGHRVKVGTEDRALLEAEDRTTPGIVHIWIPEVPCLAERWILC